jgi:transcriptional regulatory protein RtcR
MVNEEMGRLRAAWRSYDLDTREDLISEALGEENAAALDRFDRPQLADVIKVCKSARSLSEAGRILFQASRRNKKSSNDADRLSKYLIKFGLRWDLIK